MPAEWVTVRRIRIKDSVKYVWWFSKTPWPKANNVRVLKPYSPDMIRLNRRGVKPTIRPSGHVIRDSFDKVGEGSIPGNVIEDPLVDRQGLPVPEAMLKFGNNAANDEYAKRSKELGLKMHPARFPTALPAFFIKLLTEEGDLVSGFEHHGDPCRQTQTPMDRHGTASRLFRGQQGAFRRSSLRGDRKVAAFAFLNNAQ